MYKALASELTIEVFHDRSEAEIWLMIEMAKPRVISILNIGS